MPRKVKKTRALHKGTTADDLPLEMYFKVFSNLDLASVCQTRLVCKSWKLMVETCRNLKFSCHLTDETLSTAINSTELLSCVKIHDFTGKGNKVISATRGTGRLMANADSIHLIGRNIETNEQSKMMKYAIGSVDELSFKLCRRATILTVFEMKRSFDSLRKLVIAYKSFPRRDHTMALERLSSPLYEVALPSLEHFKLSYDMDTVDELYTQRYTPTPWEVFHNYLAIAKVIAKFRGSLKIVEIVRNEVLRTALVLQVDTTQVVLGQYHRLQIQQCLDRFNEMKLEKLHITPVLDEGEFPWILETTLLRRQRNLREVYLNKKLCSPRLGSQALETVLPRNFSSFTSVKISLTCMGNAPVDLSTFSQCPNLKTLWLAFYRGVRIGPARQNSLHFTNIELIPKTIKSLHFKSSQQDTIIIHQQSILSREQLRWVIDNLLELESFWMQLVAEEPDEDVAVMGQEHPALHAPYLNNNNIPVVDDGNQVNNVEEEEDQEAQEVRQLVNRLNQELNTNANVNVDTFRDLIAMPKIKELKFDMLKAGQLAAILEMGADGNPWILPMRVHVALEDISEYTAVCEQAENVAYSTQATSFFPFGFIELTVTKNK